MAHALILVVVIDRMTSSNLWLRSEKCFVLCESLTTLGHQVSATGIRLDPRKVAAVQEWPTPTSYKQLRAFLGFVVFLRANIRHSSELFASLHKVKDPGKAAFQLTADQHRAYEVLKAAACGYCSLPHTSGLQPPVPSCYRRIHQWCRWRSLPAAWAGDGPISHQHSGLW